MSVTIRFRKLADGTSRPYLDIYCQGKRMKEFLDFKISHGDQLRKEKMKMIETLRSQREIELFKETLDFDKKKKSRIDFLEYYADFLKTYKGKDIRLVKYSFVRFKKMINADSFPLSQLTPELCADFAWYLQDPKNGLRGETVHNYWRKFKSVVYKLVQDDVITRNPTKGASVGRLQNQLKKNVLTEDELQILAKTPCGHLETKKVFLFACFSGLGYAELKKMTWANIQNGKLIIQREKTGAQIIIDLHPVCLQIIGDKTHGLSDHVFHLPSDTTVSKWLKRWLNDAGIRKSISFYCGRHTYATQLLLKGASLKTVADCMGQRTTVQTLKYLNYVDNLKTEAIAKLPMLDLKL